VRRSLVVLAVSVILAGPARAAAKPHLVFASPDRGAAFPFDLHNNHVCVRGRLGKSDSVWVVLDTGASGASVSESRARALGLRVKPGGTTTGNGGGVESGLVSGVKVRLPGVDLVGGEFASVPLDSIEADTGRPMDVILGHPFFSGAVVELDYEAKMVRVFDPKHVPPDSGGTVLPLVFVSNLPYVGATVGLAGRKPIVGDLLLDTGSAPGLTLTDEFVRDEHVLDAVQDTKAGSVGGVGGTVENRVGQIERLELGPFAFDRPYTVFLLPGPSTVSAEGTMGSVGGEILRRFRVRLDYGGKSVRLEPNAAYEK
jgi:hypothetical protein